MATVATTPSLAIEAQPKRPNALLQFVQSLADGFTSPAETTFRSTRVAATQLQGYLGHEQTPP